MTGEPTESRTCIGQKGLLGFKLESAGKAAHSAYPEMGDCALSPLLDVLAAIKNEEWPKDEVFKETTTNIWVTNGGIAANVIPSEAAAQVLVRCSVGTKVIEERIKAILNRFDPKKQIKYQLIARNDPIKFEVVDAEKYDPMLVSFGTDIPSFENVMNGRCKAVLFGPGSITVAHGEDEHIDIDELRKSGKTHQDIALLCLAKSKLNIKAKL